MLGISYSPSRVVTLYGNLTHGFAAPPSRVVGEREPEESEQVEVGLKTHLRSGHFFNLALYRLERENVAIFDDLGATAQQGSQRSQGVEVELLGTLAEGLRYHFAYAYTDAELTSFSERVQVGLFPPAFLVVDRSGNSAAFAPEHTANLWLAKQWESGLALGGGARYLSEQFIGEDNLYAIDKALTFDAMLAYDLRQWRLSLNVENLTDEEYEARGFGTMSVIPGDPTSVTLGVGYRR
jgi:outer membrane receptor protein involved in Fe transport